MENTFIPELLGKVHLTTFLKSPFFSLIDGTESGTYLALDLGGTNFRVIKLVLQNGQIIEEIIEYFTVEENIR